MSHALAVRSGSDAASELVRLRAALAHERGMAFVAGTCAAGVGRRFRWEWQPGTDTLFLSTTLVTRLGLPDDGRLFPGRLPARIHPDDAAGVRDMLADLVAARRPQRGRRAPLPFAMPAATIAGCGSRRRRGRRRRASCCRHAGRHQRTEGSRIRRTPSSTATANSYDAAPVALSWNNNNNNGNNNDGVEPPGGEGLGWSGAEHGKRMAEQLVGRRPGSLCRDESAPGRRGVNRVIEAVTDCRTRDGEGNCCRWWSLALRRKARLSADDAGRSRHHRAVPHRAAARVTATIFEQRVRTATASNWRIAQEALAQIIDLSPA